MGKSKDRKPVKNSYPNGKCPECSTKIPHNAVEGDSCTNCGMTFFYDDQE